VVVCRIACKPKSDRKRFTTRGLSYKFWLKM